MSRVDSSHYAERFARFGESLKSSRFTIPVTRVHGKVLRVLGGVIKAEVPGGVLGEMCLLINSDGSEIGSEIIAFEEDGALLTPHGALDGVGASTTVVATGKPHMVNVGNSLLGRVVDGMGKIIDGGIPLVTDAEYAVTGKPPHPLSRKKISKPLSVGIRAMDAILTCGEGQRLGIFAAAGVGKSTLLGMIVKHATADVIIVGLVGERGREVKEFIEDEIGEVGMQRTVVVVATSDRPAVERAKAAHVATTIAEYFRDQGKSVLLLVDSITRYARAQREIGLASGEVPTRRGFPSSVFAELPRLLERSGNSATGSITALYTVLVEGDDFSEPVADETRSILDGHIILSRQLAEKNHYPAIDILASVSRVMDKVVTKEHAANAARVRNLLASFSEVELLLKVGEYQPGVDRITDEAVNKIDIINDFLKQPPTEYSSTESTLAKLSRLCQGVV